MLFVGRRRLLRFMLGRVIENIVIENIFRNAIIFINGFVLST